MISSECAQGVGASFTLLSSLLIRNIRRGGYTTTLHEVLDVWLLNRTIKGPVAYKKNTAEVFT